MKAKLVIDGKSIPMNKFTQEISGKVISSIAESLRGVDADWKKIVLEVEKDEASD